MTTILNNRSKNSRETARLFSQSDLVPERQLHDLKWFDYRFMAPSEATSLFRSEFQKVYRRSHAKNIDSEEAERKFGLRRGIASDNRAEFTSLWRARQFADGLGIPYPVFLTASFNTLLSGLSQRIPYVNQLYGKYDARIALAAKAHWLEIRDSRFTVSELPHYRVESFHGLPAQVAYRKWVIEEIKRRGGRAGDIGSACFIKCIIPVELAQAEFGVERVDSARDKMAGDMPEPFEPLAMADILPSCATLPGTFDAISVECRACPVSASCADVGASVCTSLVADVGSVDPVAARRRRLQSARTRKHRAKIRTATTSAVGIRTKAGAPGGI